VTIENIHQHLDMGKSKAKAIFDACVELSFPKLLILLCILAVFAPAFLMNGVPRGMFLPLSLAVGFSMLASFLLSQTLVPVLSNWWLKAHPAHEPPAEHNQGEETPVKKISGFDRFRNKYLVLLDVFLGNRKKVISIYLAISFTVVIAGAAYIGKDMMPKINHSGQFQLRVICPQGMRIERTEERVVSIIHLIEKLVGSNQVSITSAFVGNTPSSYGTNALYIFNSGPQEAVLQVALKEDYKVSNLDELKESIRKEVKKELQDVTISFEPIELTDKIMSQGALTPIEVMIGGKDLEDGKMYANRLMKELHHITYLRDIRINQPIHYPVITIRMDRERIAQMGLSPDEVAKSLVAATSSSRFTTKNLWLDQKIGFAYQVQVQIPEYQMQSVQDLQNTPLVKGQIHPTLGDIADIKAETTPAEYDRVGPRRIITVSANIFKKDLGTAAQDVSATLAHMGDPPKGSVVELKGMAKLLQETLSSLQSGLLLAIVVIFLLLAANYQSFKVAFIVLVTVPAVLAGSITLLLITGCTLNLQSYMGIIMSVGVSVANAVLIVTNAEHLRKELKDPLSAARVSGSVRLRPILMTSIAMVVGMLPMASGMSESGEQTAPLGLAVIGGLISSTFAALLVLPVVFASVQKRTSFQSVSLNPNDEESEFYDLELMK
ncbi:MAG TPA: efflux RND transporter permease subunit, partial [Bacteroidia bacterium]|nr:efflux RND transporter permease subunit [Bacteroidia bacterium]